MATWVRLLDHLRVHAYTAQSATLELILFESSSQPETTKYAKRPIRYKNISEASQRFMEGVPSIG